MSQSVRLKELLEYVAQGKILDAMEEFYADEVVMTEPAHATDGKAANIERERQFVASVKEFKNFEVKAMAIDGDVSFYECLMEWVSTEGQEISVEQVAVAKWKDGKIVHERFYYDNAAK